MMLNSLKNSISNAIQTIGEKLNSSLNRSEDKEEYNSPRSSLKRGRMSQIILDEQLKPDVLVTPPEKRFRKLDQGIGRPLGNSDENAFLWNYVVKGKTNTTFDKGEYQEQVVGNERKEVIDEKVETDVLSLSSFSFKKTTEPRVHCYQYPVDILTKRRPLNSQLSHIAPSEVLRQSSASEEKNRNLSQARAEPSDKKGVSERCILEVCGKDKSTLSSWKHARRPTTADTVIRLEECKRYKKLLAQYTSTPSFESTSISGSISDSRQDGIPVLSKNQTGTFIGDSESKGILSTTNYQNLPRLDRADSILQQFSSALAEAPLKSALLSSTPASSEVKLFKEASVLIEQQGSVEGSIRERGTRERHRVFSGMDTRNISRSDAKVNVESKNWLGDTWTLKWRKILQDEELDRQKQIKKEELKIKSYEQKWREREAELLKKIEKRKNLGKEPEEPEHVPLTDDMRRLVSDAWGPGNPQECLVQAFNVTITRHDLASLADLNWLNDEVVNFYFHLLLERSKGKDCLKIHFFNSFFYPKLMKTGYSGVRRWTKKVDIFSMDVVVLPVHLGMHWCLAAIDMRKKQIAYYDSLKGNNNQCLAVLRNYIIEEHKDKKKTALAVNEWSQIQPKNIPEQKNGCDCGVFTCMYADCLTKDSPFNFTQTDMPYFRERMVYEILTKKLL